MWLEVVVCLGEKKEEWKVDGFCASRRCLAAALLRHHAVTFQESRKVQLRHKAGAAVSRKAQSPHHSERHCFRSM